MTIKCRLCGLPIEYGEDIYAYLEGQWRPNKEMGVPMLVVDPQREIMVMQLPNGQIGLAFGDKPRDLLAHQECQEQLENMELIEEDEEEDEDDEYDE